MDWLTFIAEMTKAISWPAAIVTAVFIFRDPLLKLLRELKRLKWKNVEVEFDKEVKKAKAELSDIQRVTASEEYISDDYETRLLSLLETSPKAAVLEAWLQVEREAYGLLKNKNVALPPNLSPIRLLELLLKHKLIDKNGQNLFNTIRKLRNRAVHEYENEISENAALDYLDMASKMIRILRAT
jgi:hypothetical protein